MKRELLSLLIQSTLLGTVIQTLRLDGPIKSISWGGWLLKKDLQTLLEYTNFVRI